MTLLVDGLAAALAVVVAVLAPIAAAAVDGRDRDGARAPLVVVAAAGKSALIPFSGWLPRAMEGPTPSSAVFYGALSVHLGAFLLLRCSPLMQYLLFELLRREF